MQSKQNCTWGDEPPSFILDFLANGNYAGWIKFAILLQKKNGLYQSLTTPEGTHQVFCSASILVLVGQMQKQPMHHLTRNSIPNNTTSSASNPDRISVQHCIHSSISIRSYPRSCSWLITQVTLRWRRRDRLRWSRSRSRCWATIWICRLAGGDL